MNPRPFLTAAGLLLLGIAATPQATPLPATESMTPSATAEQHDAPITAAVVSPPLVEPVARFTPPPPPNTTDGPTPLTEEQFADLQRWLRAGKPLSEWVANHPDPALPKLAPVVVKQQPAGHWENRTYRGRFGRLFTEKVWVGQPAAPTYYAPTCVGTNCASCGRR